VLDKEKINVDRASKTLVNGVFCLGFIVLTFFCHHTKSMTKIDVNPRLVV